MQTIMTFIEQKNQQVLELLRNFVLDYQNIDLFQSLILEDGNPETTFVLYSILQKSLINGDHFTNFPHQNVNTEYFYNEYDHRLNITEVCTKHIEIALIYLQQSHNHPNYVYNQVIFTIALLLRKNWVDILKIEDLISSIITSTLQTNKIVFFKIFENIIGCIRQYSYASGYIEFRKILNNFQTLSLQRILQAIHLQIKQLQGETLITLYPQNKVMVESFINLLYQLMNLNFNLSYYEIDVDHEGKDSQFTNFPDYYLDLIIDPVFLIELFRDTIGFINIDQNLALFCIGMLQRIACVRLSIFHNKKCKGGFRRVMWEGLLYLYQNQDSFIKYVEFSSEIHSLAVRIINNLTLRKIAKFQIIFDNFFQLIQQVYQKTVQLYGVKIMANSPIVKLQELWNQIGYQGSLHLPSNDVLNVQINKTMQNQLIMVLQTFFQQNQFTEISQECSVKKFKKLLDLTFIPFHCLFKSHIQDNISLILQMIEQLRGDNEYQSASVICLTAVFLLHTSNTEYLNLGFDCYNFGQKEEPKPNLDGQAYILKFIVELIMNSQVQKNTRILKMAILSFIESFITTTIDSFCYEQETQQFKNLSQLYSQLIRADQRYQNYLLVLETMLEECFQVFTYGDPFLIEFSLKLIEYIYQKVKKYIPRKVFKACSITDMLKQFFLQLNITCLSTPQYIKKRALVFKIITIVWVDDCSDDYVNALVDIYNQIKQSILTEINKINILKYVWDLIGIASEIDVDNIYRTFLRIIYPDLAKLLTPENIELFAKDYDSSIAIITLFKAIFYNKNTRLSTENIQLILYQIYGKAMKFFIILIQQQIQTAKTQQKLSDFQLKQVSKLLALMSQICGQKKINQGFFIIYNDQSFLDLFNLQIQLILIYRPLLQHIPKYKKLLYECFDCICQDHSETLAYKSELNSYLDIFLICKDTLKDVIYDNQGEDTINENCATLILIGTLLSNIATFLVQEASVGDVNDLQTIKNKINTINIQGKQLLCEIFNLSCQITLIYPKNSKMMFAIPEILFAISIFNPSDFETLLVTLITNQIGIISNPIIDQVFLAFKNLQGELQISNKEDFVRRIKIVLEMYK
ncbi:unnamed protein product (macronuclear) [Paramecium tetraurelia]|uniref:Exportin-1 C-terminal domain-containing protein n=1 Tax=Paramecium tetraurelia TaxID=5888 RepID=A0DNG6_PARTE|nr:uncharacterized protein GSPATT00018779001 [Paramecium tetraurelia]CAK84583.1 unnamed protein product [Paramecium tetraurelia]|eukprot:XP_001451980.1 hypothetical protein (macronuclear) [Paramecium tetraurelia strain d4-2]